MSVRIFAQFILLNTSVLLTACVSSGASSENSVFTNQADYVWQLESFGSSEESQTTAVSSVISTFRFNESSEGNFVSFSGYDGCNVYGANVIATDTAHLEVVESVVMDERFCEELQYADYLYQRAYVYAVFAQFSYEYNLDERMRLRTSNGEVLVYKRCGLLDLQELDQDCTL